MKLNKILNCMVSTLLATSISSLACSSLVITDKQNNIYHGRTLELTADLPSWITYYPKNTHFQKKSPDGKNGINYDAKFEILAISTEIYDDGDEHNIFQGLNSGGLSLALIWYRRQT